MRQIATGATGAAEAMEATDGWRRRTCRDRDDRRDGIQHRVVRWFVVVRI